MVENRDIMTKAIIFDFWGTLVENGVKSPIKQVQQILHIRAPFSDYVVRMEKAMMAQKFHNLKNAFESVCAEFKVHATERQMEELIGMWNKSWMLAQPYEEVPEILKKLKEKYILILMSNTDSFSVEKVIRKFNLAPYFSHLFFSYQMRKVKTDLSFLPEVLKKAKLKVEECVIVGDSIESDIAAAHQNNIKAILIDRRNSRHFTPKITNLRELEEALPND